MGLDRRGLRDEGQETEEMEGLRRRTDDEEGRTDYGALGRDGEEGTTD